MIPRQYLLGILSSAEIPYYYVGYQTQVYYTVLARFTWAYEQC